MSRQSLCIGTIVGLLVGSLASGEELIYRDRLADTLLEHVPGILKTFDDATGHFGEGVWMSTDQNPMYVLAVAYALDRPGNRYHRDARLLEVIIKAGDNLIANADEKGQWVFAKKDGSTWGNIWMPWVYSRWVRSFELIKADMPADARQRWERALTLGFTGIHASQLGHMHNIPTHHAMGLYLAGKALDRPPWCTDAAKYLRKVAAAQAQGGYWSEGGGPVVVYNEVYVDALGIYYAVSGDEQVLPALERAGEFHRRFTYPSGQCVETIDQRNPYGPSIRSGNAGFTFTPAGRAHLKNQWAALGIDKLPADTIAALLQFGREGPIAPSPTAQAADVFVLRDQEQDKAATLRQGPWFVCLSAYTTPVENNRWIQDRQNLLSIYHDQVGLVIGGGNTKLQPAWSNFTVGDESLLAHKAGDTNPSFLPPAGKLFHVPSEATLLTEPTLGLKLTYGPETATIRVEPKGANALEYTLSATMNSGLPVAAHITLLPKVGQNLETGGGARIKLDGTAVQLSAEQVAGSITHGGWRLKLPATATLGWPALPHNPYRKDGRAEASEGRISVRIPFDAEHREYRILVEVVDQASAAAPAGETLYNGIVLPAQWPPRIPELSREPMPVPYLEQRPEVVPIDVGRQLFVDDFLIETTTLTRAHHAARYYPDNPVLQPDRPWERDSMQGKPRKATAIVFGGGVWYDPAEKLFKMWYMGSNLKRTCYATSRDGLRWDKPTLDVVEGTNILLDQERDSDTVWLDLNEKDPAKRYKMFTTIPRPTGDGFRPAIYYSGDGIHWGEPLIIGGGIGDRTTFFYNPFRERWVYSIRSLIEPWGRSRRYAECTDLVEGMSNLGRDAVLWLTADRLDPANPHPAGADAGPQLYNLDVIPYESLLVGLFSIWQGKSADDAEKRNEILVGYTRDGFHWHRPWRQPFAGVNETDGAWNWANVQSCATGCVVMGDRLYFYVSGRGRSGEPASTGLAVLRRDGFVSMDAADGPGVLTTRPVTFSGKHLFVNADAAGGELRVEILDRDGQPIAQFARNRCMSITTDGTMQEVRWMESQDLAAVAGKPVRFRFHLTRGKLYAFWVSPDQTGASHGYVAAGGPGYTEPRDTVGRTAYEAAAQIPATAAVTAAVDGRPAESGPSWECVSLHAPFQARDCAEGFIFDGRMWLSNGWYHGGVAIRDLWRSSEDGRSWTLVSDNTPYDAYSRTVVYDGKVWAIGGSVWNSTDGVRWHKVLDQMPCTAAGHLGGVVFKERIWQLGNGPGVWWTTDGVNWTCATDQAPFGDRGCGAVAVFDGKLWLMGGRTVAANTPPERHYKDFTSHHDVWCSEDGVHWTCVLADAPWSPRMWPVAIPYAGRLWLIGGFDNVNGRNLGDVWTTTDGRTWQRFDSPTQFAPRHAVTPYVFNDHLWVVAGNTWPLVNDAWRLRLHPSPAAPRP